MAEVEGHGRYGNQSLVGLLVIIFVIVLVVLVGLGVWIVFAVRNPNSAAGQCLIRVSYLLTYLKSKK